MRTTTVMHLHLAQVQADVYEALVNLVRRIGGRAIYGFRHYGCGTDAQDTFGRIFDHRELRR